MSHSDVREAAPREVRAPRRSRCRSCAASLAQTFVDLGTMPPANAYPASLSEAARERRYPLRARICGGCLLVQLDYDVPPQEIFGDYAYFSSYSRDWLVHARTFCTQAIRRFALGPDSFVVELASNDGYLLRNLVVAGIPCLGIEPSHTVAREAIATGVPTEIEFFGAALARRLADEGRRADLVIANNVLAHVPDLNDFLEGISVLLKPGGTLSAEFPHLLRLIENCEFDTIYHEHYSYFTLLAVERCLERHGLRAYDVEELPTHGGSLRVLAGQRGGGPSDGAGLAKVRADEHAAGLDRLDGYAHFGDRVEACGAAFRQFLEEVRRQGASVAGYGAAAKGVTFLNYCRTGPDEIAFVADRSPHKQGRLLPGSHIPIRTPEEITLARPDYVVILPWNLREEITGQLGHVRDWDGRLVVAVPHLIVT